MCLALSAAAALEIVDGYHPDIVLLDLGMPGMDGLELTRRLRRHPATGPIVLVALTGYGQEEDLERTRAAGIDHHLVKPVAIDTLRQVLECGPGSPAQVL